MQIHLIKLGCCFVVIANLFLMMEHWLFLRFDVCSYIFFLFDDQTCGESLPKYQLQGASSTVMGSLCAALYDRTTSILLPKGITAQLYQWTACMLAGQTLLLETSHQQFAWCMVQQYDHFMRCLFPFQQMGCNR